MEKIPLNKDKLNRKNLSIITIYFVGFTVGTISHTVDVINFGFLGYSFAPFVLNVFWTALLVLDPLVIFLFFFRYRYAILLAVIIMIFDILINLSYGLYTLNTGTKSILWGLITQFPFGCFVFLTAKPLFRYHSIQDSVSIH